ncbi:MAG: hypothetical protein V1744_03640 [Candidatus Altiarchaeota archaeon]
MMRKISVILLLASPASAIGENMFQGVYDFMTSLITLNLKDTLRMIAQNMAAKPDLAKWPIMSGMHDSFTWLSGFFMLAMTFHGVKYIMSADSPGGRANSKAAVEKLIVGMVIVSFNGLIFSLGLDFSSALTDAFVGGVNANENALAKVVMLSTISLACIITPVGLLAALLLLFMFLARYLILILLWAFFPLIFAFYFSQLGFLARIGARGVNLFISAILAGPVMGFIFKVSYELLLAAAEGVTSGQQLAVNGFEPFVALFAALAGFLLAGFSPLVTLGLVDRMGAIAQVAGTVLGAAGGGALGAAVGGAAGKVVTSASGEAKDAAGDVVGQGVGGNMKGDILDAGKAAEDGLKRSAVKVAATQDYDASTTEGKLKFMKAVLQEYDWLNEEGVIREDNRSRINVGDGGKYIAKGTNLLSGHFEYEVPHGRGFGDSLSREAAEKQGLISDGKILMKNAVRGSYGGYTVTVNDGGSNLYNVAVQGEEKTTVMTVEKTVGLGSGEEVIRRIIEESQENDETPDKVLSRIRYRGRD